MPLAGRVCESTEGTRGSGLGHGVLRLLRRRVERSCSGWRGCVGRSERTRVSARVVKRSQASVFTSGAGWPAGTPAPKPHDRTFSHYDVRLALHLVGSCSYKEHAIHQYLHFVKRCRRLLFTVVYLHYIARHVVGALCQKKSHRCETFADFSRM